MSRKLLAGLAFGTAGLFGCGLANATPTTIDFNLPTVAQGQYLNNYYDGGCSVAYTGAGPNTPDCNGPADGVTWTNALAEGTGDGGNLQYTVSDEPSAPGVLNVQEPAQVDPNGPIDYTTMNVAAGFDTQLAFSYALPFSFGDDGPSVNIWSGLDGTGSLLISTSLSSTGDSCGDAYISCWDPLALSFSGTAQSATFTTNGYLYIDDLSFGAGTVHAVPEPAAAGMFGFGLLLVGAAFAARRRRSQRGDAWATDAG